jgi:hypothetical protein
MRVLFRRKVGTQTWVWRQDCPSWPGGDEAEERNAPIPPGELCSDCMALDARDRLDGKPPAQAPRPPHVIDKIYFRDKAARARDQADRTAAQNLRPLLIDIAAEYDKLADIEPEIGGDETKD